MVGFEYFGFLNAYLSVKTRGLSDVNLPALTAPWTFPQDLNHRFVPLLAQVLDLKESLSPARSIPHTESQGCTLGGRAQCVVPWLAPAARLWGRVTAGPCALKTSSHCGEEAQPQPPANTKHCSEWSCCSRQVGAAHSAALHHGFRIPLSISN